MAISNYTELKTSIANWLHHDGVTSELADFVTVGESRINRELRIREMEEESNLSISTSSRVAALPTGFLEPIDLYLTPTGNTSRDSLVKCAPEILQVSTTDAQPYAWTVDGNEIAFNCPFDSTNYTATLRYLKAWDIEADTTNWLLTNYPDVYLWAGIVAGSVYLRDEKMLAIGEDRYRLAAAAVQTQSRRTRKQNLKSEIKSRESFNVRTG